MQPTFIMADADFLNILTISDTKGEHPFGNDMYQVVKRTGISYIITNADSDSILSGTKSYSESDPRFRSTFNLPRFIEQRTCLLKVVNAGRNGTWYVRRVLKPDETNCNGEASDERDKLRVARYRCEDGERIR
jgi:hypothetical protein